MPRKIAVLATTVLAGLATAGPAAAGTVTVAGEPDDDPGVEFTAAPGEANRVELSLRDGRVTLTDRGGPLTVTGAGCVVTEDARTVRCGGAGAPMTYAEVALGDGDDTAEGRDARDLSASGGPGDDRLTGFDVASGGAGDDRIDGTDHPDQLSGGDGDDVLAGGAGGARLGAGNGDSLTGGEGDDVLRGNDGPDELSPGPGTDRLSCGEGSDAVERPTARELISHRCEALGFALAGDAGYWEPRPTPRSVAGGVVRFGFVCPSLEEYDGEDSPCDGRVELRDTRGRLLGTGAFGAKAFRSARGPVVALNGLGRSLLARPGSLRVVLRASGRNVPRVGWSLMLRG